MLFITSFLCLLFLRNIALKCFGLDKILTLTYICLWNIHLTCLILFPTVPGLTTDGHEGADGGDMKMLQK